MSTGEIDFDPNFHISRDAAEPELPFLPVTAILWIIFISVMPILYVNMLVSYAYCNTLGIHTYLLQQT